MKHASYVLEAYSNFKNLTLDQLLQIGANQTQDPNPIPSFDELLLKNLCDDAKKVFLNEYNVLKIEGDVIVVGDIHGSYHDLLRILNFTESHTNFKVIFLGDYVDRGCFSLECITLLFSLKIKFPYKYFLLRGNHEFDSLCSTYGFKKEILNYHNPKKKYHYYYSEQIVEEKIYEEQNDFEFGSEKVEENDEPLVSHEVLCDNYFANHANMNCYKYTEDLYYAFIEAFNYMPIAAVVNKTSLCLHGGLSPLFDKIDRINKNIQRPIDDYDKNQLLCDILWGDPSAKITSSLESNPRGRGKLFGCNFLTNFLKTNGLTRLIRAHECVRDGVCEMFNEKCITVFSASSYSEEYKNRSGILKIFQKKDRIESVSFKPLNRLEKCDALYYKVRSFNVIDEKPSKPVFFQYNLKSIASYGGLPEAHLTRSEDTQQILLDMTGDYNENEPIQISRSLRMSPSNFKNNLMGKKISFNTGAQKRKASNQNYIATTNRSNYFDQFNLNKNYNQQSRYGRDDTDAIKHPTSQVTLPSLTPKATI